VTVLASLSPLLRALSADNVSPLAVVQVEALGSCFHINGDLAAEVPDLLARSTSVRLQRLSHWVGWMANDTASAMAQTAGGRAGSLLSLALSEMYSEEKTGVILYQLSSMNLPASNCHASPKQLGEVAAKLANKLKPIAYGSHLALHVTRLRETFLNSGLDLPRDLVETTFTEDTMAEFLTALHATLFDETAVLFVEGSRALGYIVAMLTALCPNNLSIVVNDEIIFRGSTRPSVIVSLKGPNQDTNFSLETIIGGVKTRKVTLAQFLRFSSRYNLWDGLSMRIEGGISDALNLLTASLALGPTYDLHLAIVELITAIVYSSSDEDFRCTKPGYERGYPPIKSLKSLLGPNFQTRVRTGLMSAFGIEPSMTSFDCLSAYQKLRESVNAIQSAVCPCDGLHCSRARPWSKEFVYNKTCPVFLLWDGVLDLITHAILWLFIEHKPGAVMTITSGSHNQAESFIKNIVNRRVDPENSDTKYPVSQDYTTYDLHKDVLNIMSYSYADHSSLLALSNGGTSLYPSTIEFPATSIPQCVIYCLVDGRLHDGSHYYRSIVGDPTNANPSATSQKPILAEGTPIGPSAVGTHSSLMLTIRPVGDSLQLRTTIDIAGRIISADFCRLHLIRMGFSYTDPCSHNPRDNVDKENAKDIFPTSVGSPLAPEGYIAMVLTHGDPEAQFLCGAVRGDSLLQSNSCLNCAVREARKRGCKMIIQS